MNKKSSPGRKRLVVQLLGVLVILVSAACLFVSSAVAAPPMVLVWMLAAGSISLGVLLVFRPPVPDDRRMLRREVERSRRELQQLFERVHDLDERGRIRTDRVTKAIADERAKESRHEYQVHQTLTRIEELVRQSTMRAYVQVGEPVGLEENTVLFVTSNGAGLGHLTRSLAIMKHLPSNFRTELLTLSTAYELLAEQGYQVRYFPSAERVGKLPAAWNLEFGRYLYALLRELRPRVVVFDGTWVYPALTESCRMSGAHLIWLQRGCWREEADSKSPQRHAAASVCDEVIIPGDFACEETVDVGQNVRVSHTSPIVLTEPKQLLSRNDACAALGLTPRKRYFLVNLGGGTIFDGQGALETIARALDSNREEWAAVVCRSPLSDNALPSGIISVNAYPVAKYFAAFDFAITAAGYNSIQENVSLGMPMILVPNQRTITDDQNRRAHGAAAIACGKVASSSKELLQLLEQQLSVGRDAEPAGVRTRGPSAKGGREAAEIVAKAVARRTWKEHFWKELKEPPKGGGNHQQER